MARGRSGEASLELYPPLIRVLRLTKNETSPKTDASRHPYITISSGATARTLCTRLAKAVSGESEAQTPFRIWTVEGAQEDWNYDKLPLPVFLSLEREVVEESDQTLEERNIQSDDTFIVEFKQPGGWIVIPDARVQQPISVPGRLDTPPPLFSSSEGFFNKFYNNSTSGSTSFKSSSEDLYTKVMKPSAKAGMSSFSSANRMMRTLEPGTLGLGNMWVCSEVVASHYYRITS